MSVCFIQFITLLRSLLSLSSSVCLSSLYLTFSLLSLSLSMTLTHSLPLSLSLSFSLSHSLTHSLPLSVYHSVFLSLPLPLPLSLSLSRFWRKGVKSFLLGPILSDPRITTSRAKNYRFRFHREIQCIEN